MDKKKNIKEKQINQVGLFIQIILLVTLVYFFIVSIFIPELINVIDYILAFILMVMAVNNYKIYKRKKMTAIYGIVGILLLVATIIGSING